MDPKEKRKAVKKAVAAHKAAMVELADAVWELAEPPLHETKSAELIANYLTARGFKVEFCIPSCPTAFRATRGAGKPTIGMLGEYDALPDCGEKPDTYGHGCGHNLLGAAPAAGAAAIADMLEESGGDGRVVYWGTPAEEALVGKVYMARDGAFRELDACLAWHPSSKTAVSAAGGSALDSVLFEFFGRTAHGARAEGGRSALDAAVLTDVAANYLREHVPENVRIHCVIPDGGKAPNVVPEYARIWYYTRAKDRKQVEEVTRRLKLCAEGAATATETRMESRYLTGVYERLRNKVMADLVLENMVLMGAPRVLAQDRRNVEELDKKAEFQKGVSKEVSQTPGKGSTDQDNVSWLTPLGSFNVACVAKDTRGHNREYTAQVILPFAHRGMTRAAEVLAATAWDLFTEPAKLRKIRAEFKKATKDFDYDPLVPKSQKPPAEFYAPTKPIR